MFIKGSKYYLLAGVMLALGILLASWFDKHYGSDPATLPIITDIGGDFELSGAGSTRIGSKNYRGQIVILFFGYTYCPDVCPTSMYTLKMVMDQLGTDSGQVQVLMITVDPERDSAAHLQEYVSHFHSRFVGLTGTHEEITEVAKLYSAQYKKDPPLPDGGYQVSHNAFFYLLDQNGRVRALHDPRSTPVQIAADVRNLLEEHR